MAATGTNKHAELQLELAAAACRAAERHDYKGAFIDVELDLWATQQVLLKRQGVSNRPEEKPTLRPAG